MEKMNKDPKAHKGLPTVFDFYTEVRRLMCRSSTGSATLDCCSPCHNPDSCHGGQSR